MKSQDHLGYPTWAHLLSKTIQSTEPIGKKCQRTCHGIFSNDLQMTMSVTDCMVLTWCDFPQEVGEILLNMMFNIAPTWQIQKNE